VFCDYVKAETLEYNDPELFSKIKEAHPNLFFDGHFVYHITRTGLNVEKIEKKLYDFMNFGREPQEKVDHDNPWQRGLSHFLTNDEKENE